MKSTTKKKKQLSEHEMIFQKFTAELINRGAYLFENHSDEFEGPFSLYEFAIKTIADDLDSIQKKAKK